MSGTVASTSTLAVLVTATATLVLAAVAVAAISLVRSSRALRRAAEDLAERTSLLLDDVGVAFSEAEARLARVDDLVGSAESLTRTVGAASRLAYVVLSNPLIKLVALGRGTSRASSSLARSLGGPPRRRRLGSPPRR